MIFTSTAFFVTFGVFFILYWLCSKNSVKLQNVLILLTSYFVYAWWDWRFLSLLIGTSLLNFILGIYIDKAEKEGTRKLLLYIGLVQGIGGLILFKYYNFFAASLSDLFASLNIPFRAQTLNLLLPLGISFYTFKMISYLLDINSGKAKPSTNLVSFMGYVAFFPTLLSGPIDKATTLLPQFEKPRTFDYAAATSGLRQILWGLFKKIVIADNCAGITDLIFTNHEVYPSLTLLTGAFLYTIQIYADFSGYSDMAIGFSRLIGFNITKNFDFPFFSQNVSEFWRKWHISLTSWLTEYVFTPLAILFRDLNKMGIILAIVINFTICGIWHGANWTFILFGFVHGCYFIPLILNGTFNKKKKEIDHSLSAKIKILINTLFTFVVVMLTFILFRADNITHAVQIYKGIFNHTILSPPAFLPFKALLWAIVLLLIEWVNRKKDFGLDLSGYRINPVFRWSAYILLIILIITAGSEQHNFIYVQF